MQRLYIMNCFTGEGLQHLFLVGECLTKLDRKWCKPVLVLVGITQVFRIDSAPKKLLQLFMFYLKMPSNGNTELQISTFLSLYCPTNHCHPPFCSTVFSIQSLENTMKGSDNGFNECELPSEDWAVSNDHLFALLKMWSNVWKCDGT